MRVQPRGSSSLNEYVFAAHTGNPRDFLSRGFQLKQSRAMLTAHPTAVSKPSFNGDRQESSPIRWSADGLGARLKIVTQPAARKEKIARSLIVASPISLAH